VSERRRVRTVFNAVPDRRRILGIPVTIPQVEKNLFRSTENVVLNKILGYKIHGEKHTFLEDY
jgi:hypothetical protein